MKYVIVVQEHNKKKVTIIPVDWTLASLTVATMRAEQMVAHYNQMQELLKVKNRRIALVDVYRGEQ